MFIYYYRTELYGSIPIYATTRFNIRQRSYRSKYVNDLSLELHDIVDYSYNKCIFNNFCSLNRVRK